MSFAEAQYVIQEITDFLESLETAISGDENPAVEE